ncbi:MAG: type II toxin-antitoxin system HicA family toxin [Parachlamydiaceae bacterium]|nr:type II toxin-antitoxin system HicA family toxin [Parachlamydiaceae bacterium]
MNKKHQKTLLAIFKTPLQTNVLWEDVEKLFIHMGARIKEGNGSRLAVELNGIRAYFHRPHPQKEIDKGALVSVRKFLENARIKQC